MQEFIIWMTEIKGYDNQCAMKRLNIRWWRTTLRVFHLEDIASFRSETVNMS